MRDDEAFLRAIGDRPDDDLPRLIYADYLDERGNYARAEFIRIGCQRARLGLSHAGWHKLAARELALLAGNQPDWEREFEPASIVRFDRGFAAEIEVEAAGFARHYRRILNAGPTPAISLRNAWEALDDLVQLPVDLGVRELSLADNALTNADLEPLLKAGW